MFGKSSVKMVAATLATIVTVNSPIAAAAVRRNYVRVGNVAITGTGMSIVGSVTTSSFGGNVFARIIGWSLIITGTLVNGGTINSAEGDTVTVPASKAWNSMVNSSKIYASNAALIGEDSEISNAARAMKMAPQALAQLVLDVDAATKSNMSPEAIRVKYFGNDFGDPAQEKAFNNIVALASMK